MIAERALVARLEATAGVTALVGQRIYAMSLTQAAAMPAITYQKISPGLLHTMQTALPVARPRLQVNCWADTYSVAKAVAGQVRNALNGYDDGTVAAMIIDERDLLNPDSLRECVSQDYAIWERRESNE